MGVVNSDNFGYPEQVDSTHPYVMNFNIDENVNVISKVLLKLSVESFRAYEKGASTESTKTATSGASSNATSGSSSDSTSGASSNATSGSSSDSTSGASSNATSGSSSKLTTPSGNYHQHTMFFGKNDVSDITGDNAGYYQYSIPNRTVELNQVVYIKGDGSLPNNIITGSGEGEHVHDISHTHTNPHTHQNPHTHNNPHTHQNAHTHQNPHTHNLEILGHNHNLIYGIYETPSNLGVMKIYVDGVWAYDAINSQEVIDLTLFVTVKGWHKIEITSPSGLNRYSVSLSIKTYIGA